jgi:hypothetical protein
MWKHLSNAELPSATGFSFFTIKIMKERTMVEFASKNDSVPNASGCIDKLLLERGAITVMFVDREGELIVADAETGEVLKQFCDQDHPTHSAKIEVKEVNNRKEPELIDKRTRRPMESPALLHSRVIYFWRYTGSTCECVWSSGQHRVRRRG